MNGEIPSEKIRKLILNGVFKGVSNSSYDWLIKKINNKNLVNKSKIIGSVKSLKKFIDNFGTNIINEKDIQTSFKHSLYNSLFFIILGSFICISSL